MKKPSTPKGTRDFLPSTLRKRNYIFSSIRRVFEKYGYDAIETPAMEHVHTLLGKYGEEGDRLIFKILKRGDKLQQALSKSEESLLAEEALRYDLTVPFARFVVQHQNDLSFPFRRYQIQPVWRADRPQRGRYREFYQCDADVIGTDSLRCEVEFVQIFDEVFTALGLPVSIRINNRKLLSALATYIGNPERIIPLTVSIDKLDKMSLDAVLADLSGQGFSEAACRKLREVFALLGKKDGGEMLLDEVDTLLGHIPEARKGVEELKYIFERVGDLGMASSKLQFDISLARGLNYYTGAIFEVVPLTQMQVGSVCGGGRYDDLTGIFGMPGMSGVGISFGADRIYDLLEAEGAFSEVAGTGTTLLFVNFGESEADHCQHLLKELRMVGTCAELYPDSAKLKKQFKYADDKNIPLVALIGEEEIKSGVVKLKQMSSGEQHEVKESDLSEFVRNFAPNPANHVERSH